MTREARLGRGLVLLILVVTVQPLFALGCIALPDDGVAPPAAGTALFSATDNDDDNALDIVFGGDPVVFSHTLALPLPEPRTDLARPSASHLLPRVPDTADHPPRLA